MTGKETRSLVLGHLQRGGSPTTFDRLLGLRFGAAAVRVIADGKFGTMVALRPPTIAPISIDEALAAPKTVPLDSDTIATARDLGIALGVWGTRAGATNLCVLRACGWRATAS